MKKTMDLSEKDYNEVAEKFQIEQLITEQQSFLENQYEKLLNERILVINDIIDQDIMERIVLPLIMMDNDNSGEKITIYLNTSGGSVHDGLCLCNVIENLKTPTDIIVLGYAYSMGSIILISGKNNPNVTRYCYPFSTALIHGGSNYVSGTSSQVKDYFKFNVKFEQRITDFIISHTNFTSEDYEAIERYETYMDSDEMLEKGLVDYIIK